MGSLFDEVLTTTTPQQMDPMQRIEQDIEAARVKFDQWKDGHTRKLLAAEEQAGRDATENEEAIKRLYKEEQDLLKNAKKFAMENCVEHEKVIEIDQEIAELNCRMQTLPKILEDQVATMEASKKKIEDLKKALAKAEKDATHNMCEKRTGQQVFQDRLGMKFERVGDDHLKVAFTQIDCANPDKEFWFAVEVDADNVYQIKDGSCKPPIAELPEMLHTLNESNNFGSFVRQMRNKFVQTTVA